MMSLNYLRSSTQHNWLFNSLDFNFFLLEVKSYDLYFFLFTKYITNGSTYSRFLFLHHYSLIEK